MDNFPNPSPELRGRKDTRGENEGERAYSAHFLDAITLTCDTADKMMLNGRADALVTFNTADFAKAARGFRLLLLTPGGFYLQHLHRHKEN